MNPIYCGLGKYGIRFLQKMSVQSGTVSRMIAVDVDEKRLEECGIPESYAVKSGSDQDDGSNTDTEQKIQEHVKLLLETGDFIYVVLDMADGSSVLPDFAVRLITRMKETDGTVLSVLLIAEGGNNDPEAGSFVSRRVTSLSNAVFEFSDSAPENAVAKAISGVTLFNHAFGETNLVSLSAEDLNELVLPDAKKGIICAGAALGRDSGKKAIRDAVEEFEEKRKITEVSSALIFAEGDISLLEVSGIVSEFLNLSGEKVTVIFGSNYKESIWGSGCNVLLTGFCS